MVWIEVNIGTHPALRTTGHPALTQDKVLGGNEHTDVPAAPGTPSSAALWGIESQKHRIVSVGRDL